MSPPVARALLRWQSGQAFRADRRVDQEVLQHDQTGRTVPGRTWYRPQRGPFPLLPQTSVIQPVAVRERRWQ
jgi:hypothetical protein